jgi:hypothetical protein
MWENVAAEAGCGSKARLAERVCEPARRVAAPRGFCAGGHASCLWSIGHLRNEWPGLEQLQVLAAGQAYPGAPDKVKPRAEGKVLDHAGAGDLAGRRLAYRSGGDVRGRARDAARGELELDRMHRQLQGRSLLDQGDAHSTARTAPSKV